MRKCEWTAAAWSKGRSDMEVTMKNHGWRTAGTLIAALLLYEIGKLAGALAAQLLLPASGEAAEPC